MRRWFTFLDGAEELDKVWHTLLLGLVTSLLIDGEDGPRFKGQLWANLFHDLRVAGHRQFLGLPFF